MPFAPLIPELNVGDLGRSLTFYCDIIGFNILFDRRDEKFCFLALGGAQLMIEQVEMPYAAYATGAEPPAYGRVMNLEIQVPDIDAVHERVVRAGTPILVPMQERRYRTGDTTTHVRQFVVADPDGFVIRPQVMLRSP